MNYSQNACGGHEKCGVKNWCGKRFYTNVGQIESLTPKKPPTTTQTNGLIVSSKEFNFIAECCVY